MEGRRSKPQPSRGSLRWVRQEQGPSASLATNPSRLGFSLGGTLLACRDLGSRCRRWCLLETRQAVGAGPALSEGEAGPSVRREEVGAQPRKEAPAVRGARFRPDPASPALPARRRFVLRGPGRQPANARSLPPLRRQGVCGGISPSAPRQTRLLRAPRRPSRPVICPLLGMRVPQSNSY